MKQRILVSLAFAVSVAPLLAQGLSTPMATVRLTKTEIISERQFREEVSRLEQLLKRPLTETERKEYLDSIVDSFLLSQHFEREGIKVDSEFSNALSQLRAQINQQQGKSISDSEFDNLLANDLLSQGVLSADPRRMLRQQMLVSRWLEQKKQNEIRAIPPVTPQEILKNYELLKAQLVQPESARIALVYYPFQADTQAERDKGAQTIRAIQDRLAKGESFDSVRLKAADLTYGASRDLLVPRTPEGIQIMGQFGIGREQFDMIFALRDGSNTAPFQTQAGWFIARKFETFPQKQLELSDPVAPGQTLTVQAWLAQQIAGQRQQEFIAKTFSELRDQLRKQAEVRITGRP